MSPTSSAELSRVETSARRRLMVRKLRPRRAAQLTLSLLWLLDGALQFQPSMYTSGFPRSLTAAAAGNPAPVAVPMRWADGLIAHHLVLANTTFATVQLLIGLGLLWHRSLRAALAISIGWSLGVWWFGEGLGGILTGAGPIDGFPGAVILYGVIAVLVWPRADAGTGSGESVATSGPGGGAPARIAWSTVWGGLALTGLLAGNGSIFSIVLAGACTLVAASVWSRRTTRAGVVMAVAISLSLSAAQHLGGLLTGTATDPNTGPLLVLLSVCFWTSGPSRPARRAPTTTHSDGKQASCQGSVNVLVSPEGGGAPVGAACC